MHEELRDEFRKQLDEIHDSGAAWIESLLTTPQEATVGVRPDPDSAPAEVLNFCANNYLGLANHPEIVAAAIEAIERWGYGLASGRIICGTQDIHIELERGLADLYHAEAAILYTSCMHANNGVFEPLVGEEDAIVTDALNHASIIDGVRLSKARRYIYQHSLEALEENLKGARNDGARRILIATDGVFSMDGDIVDLPRVLDLADEFQAMVMVDDSHGTGALGDTGAGSVELHGCLGRVDIVTSTLGKAMGGAAGGFIAGHREIVELLRQRSRSYIFTNTLPPAIVGGSIRALELVREGTELRERLHANTRTFRSRMTELGFVIPEGIHPIVPIMLGHLGDGTRLAIEMCDDLFKAGIFVLGFRFPVVPRGMERIRVQISAAHSSKDIGRAVDAFEKVGREQGVI